MAERFVRGFVVSSTRLQALVGSGFPIEGPLSRRSDARREIEQTLEGQALGVDGALEQLSRGTLEVSHAQVYRRVSELLLGSFGLCLPGELDLVVTYYLPNDSFGRWNPVLKAMGYPRLARIWAADNLSFPWPERPPSVDLNWPTLTLLAASELPALAAELSSPPAEVPRPMLLPGREGSEELVTEAREELGRGLRRLRSWLTRALAPQTEERPAVAPSGNDLLLWMDGDQ